MRAGAMVTWPKLHMIENRTRIEKQILLGRQVVRKTLRGKSGRGHLEPRPLLIQKGGEVNPDETRNIRSLLQPVVSSPQATGSDLPLSVDTDAETAFAGGSRWFFRRGRSNIPGDNGLNDSDEGVGRDPLTSSTIRQKWASDLLNVSQAPRQEYRETFGESPPLLSPPKEATPRPTSSGFFSKLRGNSLSSITAPFRQDSSKSFQRDSSMDSDVGHAWSSDSSSDDGISLDERRQPRLGSTVLLDPSLSDDSLPDNDH